jgi:pimeloyl-ACP methyl ester carboxylesterase
MMLMLVTLLAVLLLGLLYQLTGVLRDRKKYPPPGKLVDLGGSRLHLRTTGQGSPTVILESGIAASSASWSGIQAMLSKHATVCSYDRAGFGWSDPRPEPRTPRQLALELHELVMHAELQSPFVLVGHSFGGLIVRAFAVQYPNEVAGLVLVDALHHGEWLRPTERQKRMLRGGVLFSRVGVVLASVGVVRLCLDLATRGSLAAPKAVLKSFGKDATALVERIVGEVTKLPPEILPAIRAQWSRPKPFATMARYLAALPQSSSEFTQAPPLPAVPMIVLSAECAGEQLAAQRELVSLCTKAEHRVIRNCGHWMHLDQPEAVVEAVKNVLAQAHSQAAVRCN